MKMKAAVLREFNTPLVIEELEIPKLKCGQVLIKVYCSGICGSQLGHIRGAKTKREFLPFLLGHEGGGEVVDVGDSVRHVKKRDRVVMHWRQGAGIESEFPRYRRSDGSYVGAGLVTTFNEYAVVSENRVTAVSRETSYDIAALMGCCVTTALGLINNEARLKIGESIAVFGCGGVGLSIVQGASRVSGNPIIAIDIDDHKLEMAEDMGATHIINASEVSRVSLGIEKIVGSGVDVFVDTTGNVECIETAYSNTKPQGRTIMVGQPKNGQHLVLHSVLQHFEGKTLMDSEGGQTNPTTDINRYLNLHQQGRLNFRDLISCNSRIFTLDEINVALDMLRSGLILGRGMIWMN